MNIKYIKQEIHKTTALEQAVASYRGSLGHPALYNYAILENECVPTKILISRHDLILEY